MDVEPQEIHETGKPKPRRSRAWSYLLVGLVGAIIGGLLTSAIVPRLIIEQMEALQISLPSSAGYWGGESSSSGIQSTGYTPSGDPWQVVVDAAEKVSPAVVGIVNTKAVYDIFGRQYVSDSSGSGVIITSDGYIVTNNHVISGDSRQLTVFLSDRRTMEAEIVGTDPATDLAVIKIDATGLPTAVFGDSDTLKPGQLAIAIGNPLGMEFNRSVTVGAISGLDRVLRIGDGYMRLVQTDAVINPGNSGGPLINGGAQVIGLNSAKLNVEAVEGMGFAIPSNQVKRIVTEIMETGKVRRAFAGLSLMDRTEARIYRPTVKIDRGIYVYDVVSGGPAAKAGIRQGDVVIEFAGRTVNDVGTFVALISELSPGDNVKVKVLRDGQEIEFTITLVEAPSSTR
ncbi:MAG TPA: PDZ domain-containing protein [Firmicutes bacterium]|nr:PDZ domain-containing protein [Bacillota bacterium]